MIGQIAFIHGHFQVDRVQLDSGDILEVLIVDGLDGHTKWIETEVQRNEDGYYLTGLFGYNPIGLFARTEERR